MHTEKKGMAVATGTQIALLQEFVPENCNSREKKKRQTTKLDSISRALRWQLVIVKENTGCPIHTLDSKQMKFKMKSFLCAAPRTVSWSFRSSCLLLPCG